jgi:hypothetical protein
MNSLPFPRLFLALVAFCFVSLILQEATLLVSADESTCTADDPGLCKPQHPLAWIDEMGDKTTKFLQEKVFGQKELKEESSTFLSHLAGGKSPESVDTGENPFFKLFDRLAASGIVQEEGTGVPKDKGGVENDMVALFIEKSRILIQEEHNHAGLEILGILQEALQEVAKQLQNTFGKVLDDVDASIAVSLLYYMAEEDAKKNPTWKRRQHRFYNKVSKPTVLQLHDALYLSQLAYVDTLDEFKTGLANFRDNAWELLFGTTDSTPTMPSHFLLIHKNLVPLHKPAMSSILPWEIQRDNEIEVTLVVRGTKHLSDMVSDALLEPAEYRGGTAHGGILASGQGLAEKYASKLKELLKHSGRNKIRLHVVGHSLGAGAGAIAAMELHDLDFLNVEAVGFGCPSLVSEELSLASKDYITTVVADADIVPRMSGASMMNVLMKLLEFDWTDLVLEDIEHSLDRARNVLPFGDILPDKETVMKRAMDFVNKQVRPNMSNKTHDRVPNLLIPPGNCIHFFRDGVGFSGSYTPCNYFGEIDLVRTLVDDHLMMPGYHRALINFMRDLELDYNVSRPCVCIDVVVSR